MTTNNFPIFKLSNTMTLDNYFDDLWTKLHEKYPCIWYNTKEYTLHLLLSYLYYLHYILHYCTMHYYYEFYLFMLILFIAFYKLRKILLQLLYDICLVFTSPYLHTILFALSILLTNQYLQSFHIILSPSTKNNNNKKKMMHLL